MKYEIKLNTISDVPIIKVDGEIIEGIVSVDFNWSTSGLSDYQENSIIITYIETNEITVLRKKIEEVDIK